MSEIVEQSMGMKPALSTPDDRFRLWACPECQYSLESLPAAGVCPECGRAYDTTFIVLQDDVGAESEPARRRARRRVMEVVLVAFMLFWVAWVYRQRAWTMVIWMLPAIAIWAVMAWNQVWTPLRARTQLWLSPLGAEQVQSTEDARRAARMQRWLRRYAQPVTFMVVGAFLSRHWSDAWIFFAIGSVSALFAVGGHLIRKRADTRVVVAGGDHVRRLVPWRTLDRCEVTQPEPGRVRVRLRQPITVVGSVLLTREWVADLNAPFPTEQFEALRSRVERWYWSVDPVQPPRTLEKA